MLTQVPRSSTMSATSSSALSGAIGGSVVGFAAGSVAVATGVVAAPAVVVGGTCAALGAAAGAFSASMYSWVIGGAAPDEMSPAVVTWLDKSVQDKQFTGDESAALLTCFKAERLYNPKEIMNLDAVRLREIHVLDGINARVPRRTLALSELCLIRSSL